MQHLFEGIYLTVSFAVLDSMYIVFKIDKLPAIFNVFYPATLFYLATIIAFISFAIAVDATNN